MTDAAMAGDPFDPVDITPAEALKEYLDAKKDEFAKSTLQSHKSRLGFFVDWCEEKDIDSMLDLHPVHISRFRTWRRDLHGMNQVTLRTNLNTLKVFLRWCAQRKYCHPNLEDKVDIPELNRGEKIRKVFLPAEHGEMITEYLRRYHYGSEEHAVFELMWSAGLRLCTIHGLDVDDIVLNPDEPQMPPHANLVHRPEQGTTLKNGLDSERIIGLPGPVRDAIGAWITNPDHPETTDEYGREPLFATTHGRRHRNGIREIIYGLTRPCTYLGECPLDDHEMETCTAARDRTRAYECPESVSPHAVRKGAATRSLKNQVDDGNLSERMDCSEEVLWEWYSMMNQEEEMERRFDEFEEEYE